MSNKVNIEFTSGGRGAGPLMYFTLALASGLFTAAIVRGMSAASGEKNEFVTLYQNMGAWATPAAVVGGLATFLFLLLALGALITGSHK